MGFDESLPIAADTAMQRHRNQVARGQPQLLYCIANQPNEPGLVD
jgi:hypothetical protein